MKTQGILLFTVLLLGAGFAANQGLAQDYVGIPYVETSEQWWYDAGGQEAGQSVGVDGAGNTYVAITSNSGNGSILKYSSSGTKEWEVLFDEGNLHPTNEEHGIPLTLESKGLSAIAVDDAGNVYAGGETFNGTNYDCLVKKYDARGSLLWTRTYDYHARYSLDFPTGDNFCNDIALDGAGHVIAAGALLSNTDTTDAYSMQLVKWDTDGTFVWDGGKRDNNRYCAGQAPCEAQILRIAVSGKNRIYVLGRIWTQKYWIGVYANLPNDPNSPDEADLNREPVSGLSYHYARTSFVPKTITADAAGNLYAVGRDTIYVNGTAQQYHKMILFDSNFTEICEDHQRFGSHSYYHDDCDQWDSVILGPNGNAYVVGSDQGDLIAMEYDSTCTPQWTDAEGRIAPLVWDAGGFERVYGVAVGDDNSLIITGATGTACGALNDEGDAMTIKYDFDLEASEMACHDGIDNDQDGWIDCEDPGCGCFLPMERNCADGIDDEKDGLIDCEDPDCSETCPCKQVMSSSGVTYTDADKDTYSTEGGVCGPADCDDTNPDVHPGAVEICNNSIDEDCDGVAQRCTVHDVSLVSVRVPQKVSTCSSKPKKIRAGVLNSGGFPEVIRFRMTANGIASEETVSLDPGAVAEFSFLVDPSSLAAGTAYICLDLLIEAEDVNLHDNTTCGPVTVVGCQ